MPALVVALVLTYCDDPNRGRRYHGFPPDTRCYVTIQQGVWGNVWFWEGDFMPPGFGTITPVVRAVHAHELTTYDQVDPVGSGCFFRSINRRLVATTYSDSNGFFQMTLPAGCY
ncbi:hypothetical protein FJY70_01440, partial [candidate division WOR-3 bacterium]|nr:hypothetical protein [candidate division WOR-3 bacterium]